MKGGKIIVSAISVVLVVGVVIGVVATVNRQKSSKEGGDVLSSASKAVTSICSQTDYKQACVASLSSVSNNQTATPKDYIHAAIKYTAQEMQSALDNTATIGKPANDSLQKMAVEDCKELLQYANDELQASLSTVGDADLHTISERKAELLNWLSAVISYQQTCMDGFTTSPELKKAVTDNLQNATQLTDNALAIITSTSQILEAFNISINNITASNIAGKLTGSTPSRRLLADGVEVDNEGFPTWVSGSDRRLLRGRNNNVRPNVVVAKDGSGQYKTIAAALAAYPKNHRGRYVIYVKAGVYNEYITVTKDQVNVFMYGDGPRKTIVTGRKSYIDGITTYKTASFSAVGAGFMAKAMGFQNTAGPEGHQAVALRSQSDMSVFYNCRMDGYQDTLYAQAHRQFYRNCVISGTVDFIFGDSSVVIQNSLIIARKPMDNQQNTVTAHGRTNRRETTGLVIHNCRIVPEQILEPVRFEIPTYLGRPWKEYSRTVIMQSTLADFIQPAGWMPWSGNFALDTLYYAEYGNRGPGANTARRVRWKGYQVIKTRNEALQFTVNAFIQGNQWLPPTGVPFLPGLKL